MSDFKLGRYQHYKGGMYTAIGLVIHHETRRPMVLYTSDDHPGAVNVRPLTGWYNVDIDGSGCRDEDGWEDKVQLPSGNWGARFVYVGESA